MSDVEVARTIGVGRLYALRAKWQQRCQTLAAEGKFWEAGRLNEAVNELGAIIDESRPITTDTQVRDAYERAQTPDPLAPYRNARTAPINWPGIRVTD